MSEVPVISQLIRDGSAWTAAIQRALSAPDPRLAFFQQVAVEFAEESLRRHNGFLLCDAPGLGKTHVASSLAERFGSTLVLTPASLREKWSEHCTGAVRLRSHQEVSLHGLDCVERPELCIVDEAHRFRNRTRRRAALAELCRRGVPVLLCTATPVHRSHADLVSLVQLFCPGFQGPVDDENASDWRAWARSRDLDLLWSVSVRRDADSASRLDSLSSGAFWRPAWTVTSRRDLQCERPDREGVAAIDGVASSLYASASPLFRTVLLRRAASSPAALRQSLRRLLRLVDHLEAAQAAGRRPSFGELRRLLYAIDGNVVSQAVLPFWYGDTGDGLVDCEAARRSIHAINPTESGLTDPFRDLIIRRALQDSGRSVLVFTEYLATARAVLSTFREAGIRVAMIGGGYGVGVSGLRAARGAILKESCSMASEGRPMVLICTAVAAEGVDIDWVGTVVHYDLPWTSAREDQREGRASRAGRANSAVIIRCSPSRAIEEAIGLSARLRARRSVVASLCHGPASLLAFPTMAVVDAWSLVAVSASDFVGVFEVDCDEPFIAARLRSGRVLCWIVDAGRYLLVPAVTLSRFTMRGRCVRFDAGSVPLERNLSRLLREVRVRDTLCASDVVAGATWSHRLLAERAGKGVESADSQGCGAELVVVSAQLHEALCSGSGALFHVKQRQGWGPEPPSSCFT